MELYVGLPSSSWQFCKVAVLKVWSSEFCLCLCHFHYYMILHLLIDVSHLTSSEISWRFQLSDSRNTYKIKIWKIVDVIFYWSLICIRTLKTILHIHYIRLAYIRTTDTTMTLTRRHINNLEKYLPEYNQLCHYQTPIHVRHQTHVQWEIDRY